MFDLGFLPQLPTQYSWASDSEADIVLLSIRFCIGIRILLAHNRTRLCSIVASQIESIWKLDINTTSVFI